MVGTKTRLHIANFFLEWIRRDATQEALAARTQREIRDELLRLACGGGSVRGAAGLKIANELTRWLFSGKEDIKSLRWREDLACRRMIVAVIDAGLEKGGADLDSDITDDLLAPSYPRLFDRLRAAFADAAAFAKAQQSLGKQVREAEGNLVRRLRGSLEDWELSA